MINLCQWGLPPLQYLNILAIIFVDYRTSSPEIREPCRARIHISSESSLGIVIGVRFRHLVPYIGSSYYLARGWRRLVKNVRLLMKFRISPLSLGNLRNSILVFEREVLLFRSSLLIYDPLNILVNPSRKPLHTLCINCLTSKCLWGFNYLRILRSHSWPGVLWICIRRVTVLYPWTLSLIAPFAL